MKIDSRPLLWQITWAAIFALAMGLLEGICVIYLRRLLTSASEAPAVSTEDHWRVETVREACTIAMLAGAACLAGNNLRERLAYFLLMFGVWDIFYYVGLKWLGHWPSSWLEWDCLFLIPVRWYGPVLAPVLISGYLIVSSTGMLVLERNRAPLPLSLLSLTLTGLGYAVWFYSFIRDSYQISHHGYQGIQYSWLAFSIGLIFALSGIWSTSRDARRNRSVDSLINRTRSNP